MRPPSYPALLHPGPSFFDTSLPLSPPTSYKSISFHDSASTLCLEQFPSGLFSWFPTLLPHPQLVPSLITTQGNCLPLLSVLSCLSPLGSLGLVSHKKAVSSQTQPDLLGLQFQLPELPSEWRGVKPPLYQPFVEW